ncbi:hypothetical protein ACFQ3S_06990 [Mucilaginibacter terrae]|uniref:hypothetical protein n=1 Tax=Mucilaginibacter terrae TaxID=1955052 RepID=UPI003626BC6B
MKAFKFTLLVLILVCTLSAKSQFLMDINGRPIVSKNYDNIEGEPYYNTEWLLGNVKLEDGTLYSNLRLKFNQIEDDVYFQGKDKEALYFLKPVSEFTLRIVNDNNTKIVYFVRGIKGLPDNAFCQVLFKGNTQLIKRVTKVVISVSEYNAAVPVKKIDVNEKYYLISNSTLRRIKPDKKSFIAALSDKQKKIEDYLKVNKTDFKNDEDLAKLITYYNSI